MSSIDGNFFSFATIAALRGVDTKIICSLSLTARARIDAFHNNGPLGTDNDTGIICG